MLDALVVSDGATHGDGLLPVWLVTIGLCGFASTAEREAMKGWRNYQGESIMGESNKSEEVLANAVVEWLKEQGWEVYQEVQPKTRGPIADIVAVKDDTSWIVECKLSLSLALMAQANYWKVRAYAHRVSVAIPQKRRSNGAAYAEGVLRRDGIGLIRVSQYQNVVSEFWIPAQLDVYENDIAKYLEPEHKNHAQAGTANGGYWTPAKRTRRNVLEYVRAHPGSTTRDIVDNIDWHYVSEASALESIRNEAQFGRTPGVVTRLERKRWRYYEAEKKTTLDELAKAQNVEPLTDVNKLRKSGVCALDET